MKKLVAFVLCLLLLLSAAACNREEPESIRRRRSKTPKETTAQTQPETTAEALPEMTLEQFIEQTKVIWIMDDYVQHMYDDQYSFTAWVVGDGYCCSAYYPGEYDRAGEIKDLTELSENVVELSLVYPAGEHMGDYYKEDTATATVTFLEDGKLCVQYAGGQAYELTYGGADFEEANKIAATLA